ncbi:MAG TPA: hypothetical protein VH500_09155 [Nitrososphaeraceae archaeon]
MLLDSLLSDVSSIVNRILPESTRVILFSIIVGIAVISGSRLVLHDTTKLRVEHNSKKNVLYLISLTLPVIQYVIIGLLILVALEIILTSQYFVLIPIIALVLSWSTGAIVMGIMSFKFLQWYKAKRNLLVLLYLISSSMFCATLGSTIVPQTLVTLQKSPLFVNSYSVETKPFQANPEQLNVLFFIISIANWLIIPLSFIIWAAIAIMLNSYSKTFGRLKFWIMLSAPLVFVIVGDVSLLVLVPSINSIFDQQVIIYSMMAFGGMLTEGFLLAFAFITISKSIKTKSDSKLNYYLSISARGVAILFVSFFANPSSGSYLPFGIISASFFAFGTYLFFSGIYSSAISIASDIRLRKTIKESFLDQSKLLDNIGMADFDRKLDNQTDEILKRHKEVMEKETGIEPSISDVEAKRYVREVIEEIQKTKGVKPFNGK